MDTICSPALSVHAQGDTFPGLLGLVKSYLETLDVEASELMRIREYLELVEQRSNGELQNLCVYKATAHQR